MIDDLDHSIERLLHMEFGTALPFDLSFACPDKAFVPLTASKTTLNCYLFEVQEDRELRRVAPSISHQVDGTFVRIPPPLRVRASYCLTAWSPAKFSTGGTPELDEHHLLGQVLAALLRHPTLPEAVLFGTLAGQDPPLPTTIVRPGGSSTGADFWNALGGQLRPSLDYTVRLSLPYMTADHGPLVTTRIARYGSLPSLDRPDAWIQIGGVITDDSAQRTPVPQAWVLLRQQQQQRQLVAIADDQGRYRFERVAAGTCTLHARASGFYEGNRTLDVPEPTGDYTLQLRPV